jgi:putative membrane protein
MRFMSRVEHEPYTSIEDIAVTQPSRRLLALSLAAAVAVATAGAAVAQTNAAQADRAAPTPSAQSDAPDAKFVEKASAAGMAEVALGKLGAAQGQSQEVKTFGQKMVDDHTKANDELKTIATGKSIPVSPQPMASDTKAAARIANMKGTEFDAAFKKKMVADHEKVVKMFTTESTSGKDPDLKAFATKMLPDLKEHLQMAQQLPAGK